MRRLKTSFAVPLLALALATSAPTAALASADPQGSLAVNDLSAPTIDLSGLAPGDSSQWAAEVHNTAAVPSFFSIEIRDPGAGKLTTNDAYGLWLDVSLCPTRLATSDIGGTRTFSCPVAATPLGSAPAGSHVKSSHTASIGAGSTLAVLVNLRFPQSSNNAFENTTGSLTLAVVKHTPGARALTPLAFSDPTFTGLAFTGADVIGAIGAAFVTFVVGFLMLIISRRRRRPTDNSPEPPNCGSP